MKLNQDMDHEPLLSPFQAETVARVQASLEEACRKAADELGASLSEAIPDEAKPLFSGSGKVGVAVLLRRVMELYPLPEPILDVSVDSPTHVEYFERPSALDVEDRSLRTGNSSQLPLPTGGGLTQDPQQRLSQLETYFEQQGQAAVTQAIGRIASLPGLSPAAFTAAVESLRQREMFGPSASIGLESGEWALLGDIDRAEVGARLMAAFQRGWEHGLMNQPKRESGE
jgi:hypothetical protein